MFIHCRNSNCKYYYEDSCTKNLENEMVSFDESGTCESFEYGKSDYYDMSDEVHKEEHMCSTCIQGDDELSGDCYACVKGIRDGYERCDING